jgi:hypothetical protein
MDDSTVVDVCGGKAVEMVAITQRLPHQDIRLLVLSGTGWIDLQHSGQSEAVSLNGEEPGVTPLPREEVRVLISI